MNDTSDHVRWFSDLTSDDVAVVGGKNASLGEMIQRLESEGIRVPQGFATTADAYRAFVADNELGTVIEEQIDALERGTDLAEVGAAIRDAFREGGMPSATDEVIRAAYRQLCEEVGREDVDVAVRSSATAEDMPEASFAGQQETYLNIRGEDAVVAAVVACYASLFTDRAIAYRQEQGFGHLDVALSAGVQRMVRSDLAGAGVAFTLDTETGFPDVVSIDAAWGLGEVVVAGEVNPDAYVVFKPLLDEDGCRPIVTKDLGDKRKKIVYAEQGGEPTRTEDTSEQEQRTFVLDDDEILTLARWCTAIERHYDQPMDIEWAKDGDTGELFVVQARPETVQSQRQGAQLSTFRLTERGEVLSSGVAIGDAIATGPAIHLDSAEEGERFEDGAILVTEMTDPDWVPIMKRAAAIVTDHGGRTAHAAIVSRELGLPAVVGATDASARIPDGETVTVSCAEGEEGRVYAGELEFERRDVDLDALPQTGVRIMMNIASPAAAFRWWRLPAKGIGLARIEFIINNHVEVHPLALTRFDDVEDEEARARIEELTHGYDDRTEYFVERLARGVARIAASQYPEPVIVRLSDFKSNEYADLLGGQGFEPEEANPMLGFRGASRYYSEHYRDGFALECRAMRMAREELGLTNVKLMLPFVRTLDEADRVLEVLADNGLERGKEGLEIYMMAEIPSNVTLAEEFAERFDGFSIGSNDLTQLELGIDRDSERLSALFDERDEGVTRRIAELIERAHQHDRPVGICGQAPSDHPDFAAFLVERGIDSMSLNPDSVVEIIERVAEVEAR
ncbi:MAG: phosphoenolpyruvate synthase [Nitriliruptoraceae bacterium]